MPQTSWFPFELTRPAWLLGLAVLPVVVYYFVRSLVDFARWQKAPLAGAAGRWSSSCWSWRWRA